MIDAYEHQVKPQPPPLSKPGPPPKHPPHALLTHRHPAFMHPMMSWPQCQPPLRPYIPNSATKGLRISLRTITNLGHRLVALPPRETPFPTTKHTRTHMTIHLALFGLLFSARFGRSPPSNLPMPAPTGAHPEGARKADAGAAGGPATAEDTAQKRPQTSK